MRNHLTIGYSDTGELTVLYCGPDRAAAAKSLESRGFAKTELYMYLQATKIKKFLPQEEKPEPVKEKKK